MDEVEHPKAAIVVFRGAAAAKPQRGQAQAARGGECVLLRRSRCLEGATVDSELEVIAIRNVVEVDRLVYRNAPVPVDFADDPLRMIVKETRTSLGGHSTQAPWNPARSEDQKSQRQQ